MAVNEKLLHASIFGFYLAVMIRVVMIGNFNEPSSAGFFKLYIKFSSRFLTKWTFIMIFTYYSCMVLVHLLNLISGYSKISNKLRRIADTIFTVIVVPTGMFITPGFWITYNINRDLIFPTWLEEIIPGWVNHGVHTFNSILPLMDLLLVKHTFSPWPETLYYTALYFGSYMVCLFGTYFQHDFWLYPIFEKMTLLQSFLTCIAFVSMILLFHYIARLAGVKYGTCEVEMRQKKENHYSKNVSNGNVPLRQKNK
ncbi:unnamed protein product [Nezara viridula]|uniref:Uncharacterized protein n=1 Tax=Nezara viridula TaxID=85310 RepID=A0A9P0HSQ7_NEZVI|nr:unnamed protein product [Nezara viridula]